MQPPSTNLAFYRRPRTKLSPSLFLTLPSVRDNYSGIHKTILLRHPSPISPAPFLIYLNSSICSHLPQKCSKMPPYGPPALKPPYGRTNSRCAPPKIKQLMKTNFCGWIVILRFTSAIFLVNSGLKQGCVFRKTCMEKKLTSNKNVC